MSKCDCGPSDFRNELVDARLGEVCGVAGDAENSGELIVGRSHSGGHRRNAIKPFTDGDGVSVAAYLVELRKKVRARYLLTIGQRDRCGRPSRTFNFVGCHIAQQNFPSPADVEREPFSHGQNIVEWFVTFDAGDQNAAVLDPYVH